MVSNQEPIMTYNVILSDPDVIDVKEVVMVSNVISLGLGTFVFHNIECIDYPTMVILSRCGINQKNEEWINIPVK